jgi:cysteine desulfurase
MIYLDCNASTPVDPEVSDAIFSSLRRDYGNPSSAHDTGRRAHDILETSRKIVADLLGCSPGEIIFTSGGTESNNLALLGFAGNRRKGHVITSAIEHPSVLNVCRHLEADGHTVSYIGTDSEGVLDLERLRDAVTKDTFLISVMHANNETGVIQPVEEIARIAHEHGIAFHTDAAQTIGKMSFSLADAGADLLTVVSHKCYGPKGVGVLYVRNGLKLSPVLFGAAHERGLRPGTENVPGIAGLAKACQLTMRDIKLRVSHTSQLSAGLFSHLGAALPEIRLNGHSTQRLPNTLNIAVPGVHAYALVEKLKEHVALSSGSACHAGSNSPSRVLTSMGLSDEDALCSVRISVGKDNTDEEIETAASLIIQAVRELRESLS